jgi:hypothetical protein
MPLLSSPSRKAYLPFMTDSDPADRWAVNIDVKIQISDMPPLNQWTKIFEAADSWTLFRNGNEYLWSDVPASSRREPTCVALFQRRPEHIHVYCGKSFIINKNGAKGVINPVSYPLDQVLLMYALAEREGTFMHASAVEINGRGYLFPGRSGAGKSTISRIFVSEGYEMLSDDRIVVRKIDGAFYTFGTPWAGDAEIAANRKLPLGGIFFIIQGSENCIREMSPSESAERLMPVTSIPWYDETALSSILASCEDIVTHVPSYDLHFKPDTEVISLFREFVNGK